MSKDEGKLQLILPLAIAFQNLIHNTIKSSI